MVLRRGCVAELMRNRSSSNRSSSSIARCRRVSGGDPSLAHWWHAVTGVHKPKWQREGGVLAPIYHDLLAQLKLLAHVAT